jgi:hypothetical protein
MQFTVEDKSVQYELSLGNGYGTKMVDFNYFNILYHVRRSGRYDYVHTGRRGWFDIYLKLKQDLTSNFKL